MLLSPSFLSILQFPIFPTVQDKCTSLSSVTSISNTTITSAARYPAGFNITTAADPTCFTPFQQNSVDICRVNGVIKTSPTSSVDFEMWLPDIWYGRFLVTGNGGLGGCKFLHQPTYQNNPLLNLSLHHPSLSLSPYCQVWIIQTSITGPIYTLRRSGRTMATTGASTPPLSSCLV